MINKRLDKKGYALFLATLFVVVLIIGSLGLYASIGYVIRETKLDEEASARGYYAAIAGLRYTAILLRDPSALAPFPCTLPRSGGEDDDFFDDLGVPLTITIDTAAGGDYSVSATYTY